MVWQAAVCLSSFELPTSKYMATIYNPSSVFPEITTVKSFARGFLFIALVLLASESFGQDKTEKQAVIQEAQEQLTTMASSTGELGEACLKKGLTGKFVVDITLEGKGKVLTVFMVSSDVEEVKDQNFLKSKITELKFDHIKIAKKQRVKFRHTLTI